MNRIIFSPHLDDAALDCTDHIQAWKKDGDDVTIVTIFTKLTAKVLSHDTKMYIQNSGFSNSVTFQSGRAAEDKAAMSELECKYEYLDFLDAGFRPTYGNFKNLFSGKFIDQDQELIRQVSQAMTKWRKEKQTIFYLPFGVGNHADHLITKKSGEIALQASQISYYLDFPYAQHVSNWMKVDKKKWIDFLRAKKSHLWTSEFKKHVLEKYSSQMPLLFNDPNTYRFPEVIFRCQK